MTRDFKEDTMRSTLCSATKGLTPFAQPKMTDSDVDMLDAKTEALELATSTKVSDINSSQLEVVAPALFHMLRRQIMRFAN